MKKAKSKYFNDLPRLENIIDLLKPKNYDNKNIDDFKESIIYFIDDFLENNIRIYESYKFLEEINDSIYNIVLNTYGHDIIDLLPDTLEDIIKNCIEIYFIVNNNPRSFQKTLLLKKPNKKHIKSVFKKVKSKEQPEQRTTEWYNFRWNLLTASSIWKTLDSQANINNFIYDKCKPINTKKYGTVNIDSPFHHGHKYEPLSTFMYEWMYNTKIGEFGCIKHDTYDFLGASPDGINIKENNTRYGRLLEIKNPVSDRKLNGVPKKEYWIQMQIQMEVWDLDECDFLETRFKEYDSQEAFEKDGCFNKTQLGNLKGAFVQFYHNNEPYYEYPPFNCTKKEFEEWLEKIMENTEMTWIKNIYWYLDKYSCSLVLRNRKWFKEVAPVFCNIWETIKKERVSGYDHRKPKKRINKNTTIVNKVNDSDNKDTTDTNENIKKTSDVNSKNNKNTKKETNIIKIDTSQL